MPFPHSHTLLRERGRSLIKVVVRNYKVEPYLIVVSHHRSVQRLFGSPCLQKPNRVLFFSSLFLMYSRSPVALDFDDACCTPHYVVTIHDSFAYSTMRAIVRTLSTGDIVTTTRYHSRGR